MSTINASDTEFTSFSASHSKLSHSGNVVDAHSIQATKICSLSIHVKELNANIACIQAAIDAEAIMRAVFTGEALNDITSFDPNDSYEGNDGAEKRVCPSNLCV